MQRRDFIAATGATLATLKARAQADAPPASATLPPPFAPPPLLAPMRASGDRIVDISVCTRPFRAQGPRIEAQRLGRKVVVHNYGHGGSGWSLSWGSAQLAVQLAVKATQARGDTHIAVIGCGAIGLTSALVAQRAGLRVRIYCRERPPETRSSAATGVWSPASRICSEEHATPLFRQQWETLARVSFRRYQALLGLPGVPVEWCDGYLLSETPFNEPAAGRHETDGEPRYPDLESQLHDLRPRPQLLPREQHPFPVPFALRYTQMVFNLGSYARLLMDDFLHNGGQIEQREFSSPRQFAGLKEPVLINATGYGARALLGDDTIVPVRGQTARLIPQPEVNYGLTWRGHNLSVVPRRDGLLVQAQAEGDFGSPDSTPDRAASQAAVARLASLFKG